MEPHLEGTCICVLNTWKICQSLLLSLLLNWKFYLFIYFAPEAAEWSWRAAKHHGRSAGSIRASYWTVGASGCSTDPIRNEAADVWPAAAEAGRGRKTSQSSGENISLKRVLCLESVVINHEEVTFLELNVLDKINSVPLVCVSDGFGAAETFSDWSGGCWRTSGGTEGSWRRLCEGSIMTKVLFMISAE